MIIDLSVLFSKVWHVKRHDFFKKGIPFSTKGGNLNICFVSLAFSADSAKKTSDEIIGVIAGSVAGVVIISAAVVAVILIYKKYKARVRPIGHNSE